MPQRMQSPSNGSVPNPDPTERTVEQLLREIATAREIVEANNRATREVLETRLAGMDKAIELLQVTTNKLPFQIKGEVGQLQQLHEEKFDSVTTQIAIQFSAISTQFQERDKRTDQLSIADKTAIAAALQAQKEAAGATTEMVIAAITKMDANFTKLIDQTQNLLAAGMRNTDEKINDLKGRFDRGEGRGTGETAAGANSRNNMALAFSGIAAFTVVMTAVIGVVVFVATRAPVVNSFVPPPSAMTR